jgi:hypothetical protein
MYSLAKYPYRTNTITAQTPEYSGRSDEDVKSDDKTGLACASEEGFETMTDEELQEYGMKILKRLFPYGSEDAFRHFWDEE